MHEVKRVLNRVVLDNTMWLYRERQQEDACPYLPSSCRLWGISWGDSTGTGCGGAGPRGRSCWPGRCRTGSSWRCVWRSSYIPRMWTVRSASRWTCPRTRCTRCAGSAACPWTRKRRRTRRCCCYCWRWWWSRCWTGWAAVRPGGPPPRRVFPERTPGSCAPSVPRAETVMRPGTPARRGSPERPRRPLCSSMPP